MVLETRGVDAVEGAREGGGPNGPLICIESPSFGVVGRHGMSVLDVSVRRHRGYRYAATSTVEGYESYKGTAITNAVSSRSPPTLPCPAALDSLLGLSGPRTVVPNHQRAASVTNQAAEGADRARCEGDI